MKASSRRAIRHRARACLPAYPASRTEYTRRLRSEAEGERKIPASAARNGPNPSRTSVR